MYGEGDRKLKLTEEHENCECHNMLSKTDVCMPEKCHIIHEDTLDLYDMYQDKAEKLEQIKAQILEDQKIVDELLKEWKSAEYEEGRHYKNMLGNILTRATGKDIHAIHSMEKEREN